MRDKLTRITPKPLVGATSRLHNYTRTTPPTPRLHNYTRNTPKPVGIKHGEICGKYRFSRSNKIFRQEKLFNVELYYIMANNIESRLNKLEKAVRDLQLAIAKINVKNGTNTKKKGNNNERPSNNAKKAAQVSVKSETRNLAKPSINERSKVLWERYVPNNRLRKALLASMMKNSNTR